MIRVFRVRVLESTRDLENTGIGPSDRRAVPCAWALRQAGPGLRVFGHGHQAGQPRPSAAGEQQACCGDGAQDTLEGLRCPAGKGWARDLSSASSQPVRAQVQVCDQLLASHNLFLAPSPTPTLDKCPLPAPCGHTAVASPWNVPEDGSTPLQGMPLAVACVPAQFCPKRRFYHEAPEPDPTTGPPRLLSHGRF